MTEGTGIYFEEHQASSDLGRRALRGGIVSVAIQYGNGVLQIGASIILARLLTPEDFGLVAIVTVLTSFAPLLIDFGLGDATAQRSRLTQSQASSVFWLSSGIGLAVAVAVAACSPLIARMYGDPRLQAIALCSAITFLLSGLSVQHLALLRRTMQFGRIGRIQVIGTLAGIMVAVVLASSGSGYWALVLRPITSSFCVACGAWVACKWRPRFPVLDDGVISMVRFGLHVIGYSVTVTLARSVDRIALGLVQPPAQVGYYQNATNMYENSMQTALIQMHTVGSTALSKLQSDPSAFREKYEAALSMLAYFLMPLGAILSVTGEDLTVILLGEKWRVAGSLLSILALRGIFQVVESSSGWIHLAIGRPDRWRRWGIVTTLVLVAAVIGGLPFGPNGVATAVVVACILNGVPSVVYAGQPIGIGASLVLRAVHRQLIGALCTAAAGWWLETTILLDYPPFARIVLSGVACTCIYLAVIVGFFRFHEPIRVAASAVRDLLGRRI